MKPARVLAIGAHPDDVEYYAGAAVATLTGQGTEVRLVICTDGSRGGPGEEALAAQRRSEATRAAEELGAPGPVFLGRRDGELVNDDALRRDLVREIRALRPELVLAHDPSSLWTRVGDLVRPKHSDHRAAGQAAIDAIYPRAPLASYYPELAESGAKPWFPRELWLFDTDTADADHFVELEPVRLQKAAAIACHASQDPAALMAGADDEAEGRRVRAGFAAEGFKRLRLY